ncbi:alpha/beta hydrolase [Mycolicibacterium rufum]|uniref:Alpha/beta hydrolase n=1 Tax=Mycolicibacterium rufum TaxID=318424 RepID=A0A9X2Y9F4_9MYCO|nr:alpha/beta hydrolase [Mycolicibacterium rufum]KGI68214.1 alpha/beta hydrolase [Mycolicibacterium rufum]MCV7069734.1 alpha/beta hydrolase [Mycolicibacterium rufum]ULP39248.1 alpha/beta hydrolase [Mycolicibacterium rufum]
MTNIVFIHGLWVAHSAWEPWISYVAEQGHHAIAPAWPGELPTVEDTRREAAAQAGVGIDDLTAHYARLLEQFDTPPVVIGHSFGGLIAQKLLGENKAAAAVAIAPAPIKGVKPLPLPQLRSALPVLGNPLNRGRATGLSQGQWRYGFGNALTAAESDALWEQWSIPSPGKPLFEAATANLVRRSPAGVATGNATRGPLLIIGGTADHTVPLVAAKAAHALYRDSGAVTDFHEFDGRGHSLTIDHGWRDVADETLAWMARRGVVEVA